jgi:serine/threonine-protein kinase RsbW
MTGPGLKLDCGSSRMTQEVGDYVCELTRRARLSSSKAYWLRLAVEEITSNIAEHGYRGHGPVELAAETDEDRVLVQIEDEAPAFDPRSHDYSPSSPADRSTADAGGHGIFLALRNLDAFHYERVGGRNRNTLIMQRA